MDRFQTTQRNDFLVIRVGDFQEDLIMAKTTKKATRPKQTRKWSADVTEHSHALALENKVFTGSSPKKIAAALKPKRCLIRFGHQPFLFKANSCPHQRSNMTSWRRSATRRSSV